MSSYRKYDGYGENDVGSGKARGIYKLSELFIRKFHFSVNIILFVFAVAIMLGVFYHWVPQKDVPPFRYTDPILILSVLWGLAQVAIVSFGKEKNVFQAGKNGKMDFSSGVGELLLLIFFDMGMIYLGGVLTGGEVTKRAEIPVLQLVLAILLLGAVIAAFFFSEYITIRSNKEERALSGKEILVQMSLYVVSAVLFGVSCALSLK